MKLLENRHMCVCELAFVMALSQPAISKHLKKMVKAGLVDSEQDGFWTSYFISPKNLYARQLLSLLGQWLNAEKIVLSDLKQSKKTNRIKLCPKA